MKIILFANTDWYLYNYRLSHVKKMAGMDYDVVLCAPKGPYYEKIQKQGFRLVDIPLSRRGLNPFHELRALARLVRLYRNEKPDIVHHFTIKCVLYGSIAAKITKVPKQINAITGLGYIFITDTFLVQLVRPLVKWLYKIFLKHTRVIFQNQPNRKYFIDNKLVKREQTYLIPGSGVDTNIFTPKPIPPGPPLVILPARMLWDKGVEDFVEAAKRIKERGISARFALVGEPDPGNPASIPLSQLEEWDREGFVSWMGWQENMAEIYTAASMVCLPSAYGEGLAKSLIEGAASGRAIVTTDIPGCREVVQNGVNGWVVPPKDIEALTLKLTDMITDKEKLKSMGVASRVLAQKEFSVDKVIEETMQVYNR